VVNDFIVPFLGHAQMGVNIEAISRDCPTLPLTKRSLMGCSLVHMALGVAQQKGIPPPNILLQIL